MRSSSGIVKTQCRCTQEISLQDMEKERLRLYMLPQVGQKRDLQRKGVNFISPTIWTYKKGTAIRWIATMDHLGDVFNFSLSGMKFVKDMLIIINKNSL